MCDVYVKKGERKKNKKPITRIGISIMSMTGSIGGFRRRGMASGGWNHMFGGESGSCSIGVSCVNKKDWRQRYI